MTDTSFDQQMMQCAIRLAEKGLHTTTPNPRVGCVIVNADGQIVSEGYHHKAGGPHAEIAAINAAKTPALLIGATAYVTLEPCSHHGKTGPCTEALIAAGVTRVVYGMEDPNPKVSGRGLDLLTEAGVDVHGPVLEEACWELNPGFIKRMRQGLPFIRCKSAISLDGRTAMASGESKWITGPAARADVQLLRARSCAIVTGVDSVISDDPSLTVRLEEGARQPLRVIVDTHGRCPLDLAIFEQLGETVIACGESFEPEAGDTRTFWRMPEKNGRVDIHALARKLASIGCNEVLVETGARLAGAFTSSGLVDEYVIYLAAKLLGSEARPMFTLPIDKMSSSLALCIQDIRAVGSDWRITAIADPDA